MNNLTVLQAMRKDCNWLFHLIMTIIFLPWGIVWFCCWAHVKNHNEKIDSLILQEVGSSQSERDPNEW